MRTTSPRIWTDLHTEHAYVTVSPGQDVWLDTPAWRDWLEAAQTSGFSYPVFDPTCGYIVGVMTVRKEQRQRGGTYWTAYRRCGRHLRKIYLGTAAAVTLARLEDVAQSFRVACS